MPYVQFAEQCVLAEAGDTLLDVLNQHGAGVPFSCRAGVCQSCLVRCEGEVVERRAASLKPAQQGQGWRLACQCLVKGDVVVEVCNPALNALSATVIAHEWLTLEVLRLKLEPARPLRYAAGAHVLLSLEGVTRAYSMAGSMAEPWLEFHIDCSRDGEFSQKVQRLTLGDSLTLSAPQQGGLYYDMAWHEAPLYLLGAGTGLAPLWSIAQQALAVGHRGPLHLWHSAPKGQHYLASTLEEKAQAFSNLHLRYLSEVTTADDVATLALASRQSQVLLCAGATRVDGWAKALYFAGLPRSRLHTERFLPHSERSLP